MGIRLLGVVNAALRQNAMKFADSENQFEFCLFEYMLLEWIPKYTSDSNEYVRPSYAQ